MQKQGFVTQLLLCINFFDTSGICLAIVNYFTLRFCYVVVVISDIYEFDLNLVALNQDHHHLKME